MTIATTPTQRVKVTDRILAASQSLGRSLMLPIAVLPAAGLLLRLGQPDVLKIAWMADAGGAIFNNLSFIFAIGIAIGLTNSAGAAALAAAVGFFVFTNVFNDLIPQVAGKPDPNISMGVLSGILIGLVSAGLYNRFKDIRLPDFLAFFGGRRFVPIIGAFAALILGAVFAFIWPTAQNGVNAAGNGFISTGAIGAFLYGFGNRLLIPLGLHHVLNNIVWTQIGTYSTHSGPVRGDLLRYLAGDPNSGLYEPGFYLVMMFGLPAACLAMIRHAKFPKVAAGILLTGALTSIVTGVTEPIEFAFVFVAPLLYVVHAILTGLALAITYLLNIHLGFSFSAGLIDYLLYFGKSNTQNALLILPLGLAYAVIYYFVFSFFITRFDLATPGRGETSTGLSADWILPESQRGPAPARKKATDAAATGEDKDTTLAREIYAALGGVDNVESVEGCITRLRLFMNDPDKIDEAKLKSLGASGVVKQGKVAQVVMGTQSDRIAERMNAMRQWQSLAASSEKDTTS